MFMKLVYKPMILILMINCPSYLRFERLHVHVLVCEAVRIVFKYWCF